MCSTTWDIRTKKQAEIRLRKKFAFYHNERIYSFLLTLNRTRKVPTAFPRSNSSAFTLLIAPKNQSLLSIIEFCVSASRTCLNIDVFCFKFLNYLLSKLARGGFCRSVEEPRFWLSSIKVEPLACNKIVRFSRVNEIFWAYKAVFCFLKGVHARVFEHGVSR